MTVKMCIKPFASPISKYTESAGVCRSFQRPSEHKHLHQLKNTSLKKIMPKKPQDVKRVVALENVVSTQKLSNSIVKFHESRYGLRTANQRISSKRNNEFLYDVDRPTSATKVQVKNVGENFMFVCHDEDQEEEKEGGVIDSSPKLSVLKSNNDTRLKANGSCKQKEKTALNIQKLTTDKKDGRETNAIPNGGSGKASAGTMAFVQILLHTLSCG